MAVIIRAYQTLGEVEPGEQYLARAIAVNTTKAGQSLEGFSVFFYGATEAEARDKAAAWVEAERLNAERLYNPFGNRRERA